MSMRALLVIGLILLLLGIASLFVPIPRRERHAIEAGPMSFGVETTTRQVLPWPVSAAVIAAGVALIVVARTRRS